MLLFVGVLYESLLLIIIAIITFTVNVIFIIIRIFVKRSLLFKWGKLTAWFGFFQLLHLIHASTIRCWRTTIILSWLHEVKGHRGDFWFHIMPDSVSDDNWEVEKNLSFFCQRELILCLTIFVESTHKTGLYSISEREYS